jgi:lipoprotein-releasing system ATP-binding protein
MLKAENIQKHYGALQVLKGLDVSLEKGEVVALIGASGAGKSTLLQILGTLDEPDQGRVFYEGKEISRLSASEKAAFRNQSLGFVFQFHHLLPEFTALENICIPAYIAGTSRNEAIRKASSLLEQLGLLERAAHKPAQLSGGEQQRVSIARALINNPQLILADEPTGNLDTANSEELYNLIWDLAHRTGVGFMIATHNMGLADRADRMYHIKDGLLVS